MLILLLAISRCDAPRINPYDPENPDYSFAVIQGTIQTFSLPYQNISGVNVFWEPANISVISDNNGYFKISGILPASGKLIFQKNGYQSDTVNVSWGNSRFLNFQINLNMVPQLSSISIYTTVINQFTPPGQTSQLVINASIFDKDNDIDTVFIENAQLNLKKALGYDALNKIYETTLSTQDLNVSDIEETIGLDFDIITKDIFNKETNVGSSKVTRVIKTGVSIISPANDTTLSSATVFSWQRFKAGYPFTYMIEIYTNNFANSQLVDSVSNVSSDSVSYRFAKPLASREYYWDIWVIDQFQNRSRSLPATFIVQ
jgi:hypothetical protein